MGKRKLQNMNVVSMVDDTHPSTEEMIRNIQKLKPFMTTEQWESAIEYAAKQISITSSRVVIVSLDQ